MSRGPQARLTEVYHDVSKTTEQYEHTALQRSVTNPGQINTVVLQMMPMMSAVWNYLQKMQKKIHVSLLPVCLTLHGCW